MSVTKKPENKSWPHYVSEAEFHATIRGLNSQIGVLATSVATLQATITSIQASFVKNDLLDRVVAIEAKLGITPPPAAKK